MDYMKFEGHTKGPWRDNPTPGNLAEWLPTRGYERSVSCPEHHGVSTAIADVLHAADAALIAAAPDLLERCKKLEAALELCMESVRRASPTWSDDLTAVMSRAQDALNT